MLVAKIIGGLGNQMFQYAAARSLSASLNQKLLLDISDFEGYGLHQGFELHRLFEGPRQESQIARDADLQNVLGWASSRPIRRQLERHLFAGLRPKSMVVEPHFGFWPGLEVLAAKAEPKNIYLSGYWQSPRYFSMIDNLIRQDFQFVPAASTMNESLIARMGELESVSIHIRRGDYLCNPATLRVHGLSSIEYYKVAIQRVMERIRAPHFFVFSDDIGWVKESIRIDAPCEYVSHNAGMESFNDLRLMSCCRHNIICNSTFGWWGAWLNKFPGKQVIAPKQWFASPANTEDLIPKEWYRM